MRQDLEDASSIAPQLLVMIMGIVGAVYTGGAASTAFQQKQRLRGTTMGTASALSVGVALLSMAATHSSMTAAVRIPSLENNLVKKYQTLVTPKAERSDLKFTEGDYVFTYELIRQTILMAIRNASMA